MMSLRYFGCLLFLLFLVANCPLGRAQIATIALTGEPAAGTASANWDTLDLATLNSLGNVAFTGTLSQTGGITAANDAGLWLRSGANTALLAQSGSANVPGISSASFSSFSQAALDDTGQVSLIAELAINQGGVTADNRQGLWRYTDTGNSLLARTGSGSVPGVPDADFDQLTSAVGTNLFTQAGNGQLAISSTLSAGLGGVLTTNDRGIWSYSASDSNLVVREGISSVPGVGGANFQEFTLPSLNSSNQLAFIASLASGGGGVGSGNALGVWRYTAVNGELLARSGSGNVPGITGADFSGFGSPRINASGLVALQADLLSGGEGIWLYSESSASLLTRTGINDVPGIVNAQFEDFTLTSINDSGLVLASAGLEIGPGAVSASDNQGLWLLNGGPGLIARTGSGNVAEVPGASFASFATSALNEQGQVAFAATLQTGVAGIDSSNDGGIWIADSNGDTALVAREGQQLAGRTIASLDFLGDSISSADSFNDLGQLAFRATFTDGNSGLFLFQSLRADFNTDGFVDSADLTVWRNAFATSAAADADSNNGTDGVDFLIWQQEFGSGTPPLSSVVAVPEPTSGTLFLCALLVSGSLAFRRRK